MKYLAGLLLVLFLLIPSSGMAATNDECEPTDTVCLEKAALVAIAQATNISEWTSAYHWLSDEHHCYWEGVQCVDNRVVGLNLPSNNIVGSIPNELGNLTQLQTLILAGNSITSLPSLNGLLQLEYMDMTSNQLSTISSLSNLTQLRKLILHGNQIEGNANFLPPSPEFVDLSNNRLTGSLPIPDDISKLAYYNMSFNDFSGLAPNLSGTPLAVFNIGGNRQLDLLISDLPTPSTALVINDTGVHGEVDFDTLPNTLKVFRTNGTRLSGTLLQFGDLNTLNISDTDICHTIDLLSWLDSIRYTSLGDLCINAAGSTVVEGFLPAVRK